MEINKEGLEPQKTPETVVLAETISLSKTEFEELKHKAEVSSQNFERLKKAEEEAEDLRVQLSTNLPVENEDEVVGKLRNEVTEIKHSLQKQEVLNAHPVLKDVWNEFETFRADSENKGMNMKTAAKAFMLEKGLLEAPRKGLEKPTGGGHAPISSAMSNEDVKRLRETNYSEYMRLLKNGDIKF